MKTILGLDLGTASIGWALVKEAENKDEQSSIIKLGVRVNPITVDEKANFEKGKSITTNADRTLKRGARRNLQRYKIRRSALLQVLKRNNIISNDTTLCEDGSNTTFETIYLRSKAVTDEITLDQFARVLLAINKKRGYKSNRKANNSEEGQAIDSMEIAKILYEEDITPGEYVFRQFSKGSHFIPQFYPSDLKSEMYSIWETQKNFYGELLTGQLIETIIGKNKGQTWKICEEAFDIEGKKQELKGFDATFERYKWRSSAIREKVNLEQLTIILQEINGQLGDSSGYLGNISDRSKILYMNHLTVGQYIANEISANPHFRTKNLVFYRQDYLDEFETIWENQIKYHKELTPDLKRELRDIIIFYQRPLKSQKGLVSYCEFENRKIEVIIDGKKKTKTIGLKVCPKSSPLFQEFRIWQILNNITINKQFLNQEQKDILAKELSYKEKITNKDICTLLLGKGKKAEVNYKEILGNRTISEIVKAINQIYNIETGDNLDFSAIKASEIESVIHKFFNTKGYTEQLLHFDSSIEGADLEKQPLFKLWHLLYSFEGDNSKTGTEKLVEKISHLTGFENVYAQIISKITFEPDYCNLSAKAIRKILPFMKEGKEYSEACEYAGYRHSKSSLTREEIKNRLLIDNLTELPKNTLRNPVVEKILNQMVNVVNAIINEYGKPDEIRLEMARELKKSAKEREESTKSIASSTAENQRIEEYLRKELHFNQVSRNDIIRFKLWKELEPNGYHTLYSNSYVPIEELFSPKFDIEHIIPQAYLFDDSFSNKTIERSDVNRKKSNQTAYDFIKAEYGEDGLFEYQTRIKNCSGMSKTKVAHLMMSQEEVPSGFINRDLRDSQYIAKAAKEMLEKLVRSVTTTTGSVTSRLREDWQLVDIMQELNFDKYDKLNLTYFENGKDGQHKKKIVNWTKRNDHRHHAMDALTIAFTKHSYIQYLNNLNARLEKSNDDVNLVHLEDYELSDLPDDQVSAVVRAIEKSQMYRDDKNKLRFIPPMPLDIFRSEAKEHLEEILVSIKAKNKVVTRNVNTTKSKNGLNKKVQLTPRGQLHNESVYGRIERYSIKEEKIGPSFSLEKAQRITKKQYREAVIARLHQFDDNPKLAFSGKQALDKVPIFLDKMHTLSVPEKVNVREDNEILYTIRKPISKDIKLDKIVDNGIRRILEQRLEEYGGDANKAFSNLEENPIWLNKEKGIQIKSVSIKGVNNAIPLHIKRTHFGEKIASNDQIIPTDYVSTSNNHHIAIFRDASGHLQEQVVSYFEATARLSMGIPVIDKEYKKNDGWEFLFTMKQNEYFVFPDESNGFYPNEIDLTDRDNYSFISPHLFRVQKITTKDYVFRHHLETNVEDNKELRDTAWKRITAIDKLSNVIKVRVNHIGQIVSVGEY